jgi:DNA (cytosine-5)-methyltransferase 1
LTQAYHNENDQHAATWLENLCAADAIPAGVVDRRSIADVQPDDLEGFSQHHFFAGIGGWPAALRAAGWPADRPVWTGSCPCGPFSRAGRKLGFDDPRHLWPEWRRLIAERRPATIFGEQSADATDWLALVRGDLDSLGYAVGAVPIEAACAGADHRRQRFYFVAYSDDFERRSERACAGDEVARPRDESRRRNEGVVLGDAEDECRSWIANGAGGIAPRGPGAGDLVWVRDSHGRARRAPPGVRGLAHGVRGRLARRDPIGLDFWHARAAALRGFGNAVDLRAATAFVSAAMDTLGIQAT